MVTLVPWTMASARNCSQELGCRSGGPGGMCLAGALQTLLGQLYIKYKGGKIKTKNQV